MLYLYHTISTIRKNVAKYDRWSTNKNGQQQHRCEVWLMKILWAQFLTFIAASSKKLYSSHPWPPLTCQRTLRYTDMVSVNNFLWKACWICRKRSRKEWATVTSKISCEVKENYPCKPSSCYVKCVGEGGRVYVYGSQKLTSGEASRPAVLAWSGV